MMVVYEVIKVLGFYDKNLVCEVLILQMLGKLLIVNFKGVCLVNLLQLCDIQNEEYEKMLVGQQDVVIVLKNVIECGNVVIKEVYGN